MTKSKKTNGSRQIVITAALAQRMISGKWREGFVLPTEMELADSFSVSRTSIREALGSLKAKGFVASKQRAGTRVLPKSNWNMLDTEVLDWAWLTDDQSLFAKQLMAVRRIVEPAACALAAAEGTDEDFAAIERAYRRMDAAGYDVKAFAQPDLDFHKGILAATGNQFLVAFGALVEAALKMSFALSTRNPGAPRKSLKLHRHVLDALWKRDAAGVREAMEHLLELTEKNISKALAGETRKGTADSRAISNSAGQNGR